MRFCHISFLCPLVLFCTDNTKSSRAHWLSHFDYVNASPRAQILDWYLVRRLPFGTSVSPCSPSSLDSVLRVRSWTKEQASLALGLVIPSSGWVVDQFKPLLMSLGLFLNAATRWLWPYHACLSWWTSLGWLASPIWSGLHWFMIFMGQTMRSLAHEVQATLVNIRLQKGGLKVARGLFLEQLFWRIYSCVSRRTEFDKFYGLENLIHRKSFSQCVRVLWKFPINR